MRTSDFSESVVVQPELQRENPTHGHECAKLNKNRKNHCIPPKLDYSHNAAQKHPTIVYWLRRLQEDRICS